MNLDNELKLEQLKKDTVLEGPFWREHVRVISSKTVGGLRIKLEVVGVNSERYYHQILSEEDLKKLKVAKESKIDFSGDPEAFFLATEGWRIRYAYQFDPFCAVTVSKIDPVPHQIEAVYHYVLKNPRIRFLLADDAGAGKTIMA
ncbi:MAG: helicase, partial [Candidatus Helarchaeota archaeon]|nr:helicase [Candidatus Helarchaeota archaeon]